MTDQRKLTEADRERTRVLLDDFLSSPPPPLFSHIPQDMRDLAEGVPELDTPVWYSGSRDQRFSDGEVNTHWWERAWKRLRRKVRSS